MQAGYPKYKDVLTKSMKELGYSNTEEDAIIQIAAGETKELKSFE